MKNFVIAIDGPAGAGKSTVAKIAAEKLGYTYIDTGAMYRAVAWKVLQAGTENITEREIEAALTDFALELRYEAGQTFVAVGGVDVTEAIRTPEVTQLVSAVARVGAVRHKLVELQRDMAKRGAVVMDGRDIGTYVLADADVKIFLTASIEERALRRWREMREKGYDRSLEQLQREIAARDKTDSEREISPLAQAEDAVLLDTTRLSVEEAVDAILRLAAGGA